jgi:CRP-like cAMP-binding protein
MREAEFDHHSIEEVTRALTVTRFFGSLAPEIQQQIVAAGSRLTCEAGEVLVREGESTTDLFVLLSGEVTVEIDVGDDNQRIEVGSLCAPELIGELGMLLNEERSATIRALGRCTLLKLRADTLLDLAASLPGLGLALAREMALRLRTIMEERNLMIAERAPGPVRVPAVSIDRLPSYMARYYATAIRNVLRRHRIIADGRFPRYEDRFTLTQATRERWQSLFRADERTPGTPFTYHTASATMALMKIVADVGVNFRHLMHLRTEITLDGKGLSLQADRSYRAQYQLRDIVRLRSDRVALVTSTLVEDEETGGMYAQKDFFVIKNLAPEYMSALKKARGYGKENCAALIQLTKRKPQLLHDAATVERAIGISAEMGRAYGRVSGDLNLVHTTAVAAKVFGYARPFVQGLCTANAVLKELTEVCTAPLQRFTVSFCRPVYLNQTVRALIAPGRYEVCDASGTVLAFGDWATTDPDPGALAEKVTP